MSNQPLTTDELKSMYGRFYFSSPKNELDFERVPEGLRPLIPYAEFWGIADDWSRESLVLLASPEIRENLKSVVSGFDDALDAWLAGDEAYSHKPSREYVAFSAMRMAADFV